MWPPYLRQTLKSRFENSSDYANTLTSITEKQQISPRKALKEVSKALAEAVSELWSEREAAIKLIEQIEQEQAEGDQQQRRGTPLPSNQPTIDISGPISYTIVYTIVYSIVYTQCSIVDCAIVYCI